jgi:SAM-dependent methyltransferase
MPILPKIARRIRQAEQRLMPAEHRESARRLGENFFPLEGAREPWYGPTPILQLIEHLRTLELPKETHFVDLGSGLGNACIAAAEVFDKVTGFEIVPEVMREAQAVRDEFGLDRIDYRLEDFMQASWQDFGLIYFFKPFVEEDVFAQIAEKLVVEARPGAVIISRRFMNSWLYMPEMFDYLQPLNNDLPRVEGPLFPLSDYYTFVKKAGSG